MGLYLNTRGRARLTIGICDRCRRKFPIGELRSDPNAPGLKVCVADLDEFDPFRLAPRQPDDLVPPFVRKDVDLSIEAAAPAPGDLLDGNGAPMVLDTGLLA